MLGINKVEQIDSDAARDDLILEKLIGDTFTPSEDGKKRHTIKLDQDLNQLNDDATDSKVVGKKQDSNQKVIDGEIKSENVTKHTRPKSSFVGSIVDSVKQVFGGKSTSKQSATQDVSEKKEQYTKITVEEYRSLLKRRSHLMHQIEELEGAIANGDNSVETRNKLAKLKAELTELITTLSGLKLFYAIDHVDDPMVISEIREYRDGFIMIINENNIRYRSIQSDVMALALHVAEA